MSTLGTIDEYTTRHIYACSRHYEPCIRSDLCLKLVKPEPIRVSNILFIYGQYCILRHLSYKIYHILNLDNLQEKYFQCQQIKITVVPIARLLH